MTKRRRMSVSSGELLLAWHLLHEYKPEKHYPSYHGKEFVRFNFFLFTNYRILTDDQITYAIQGFLKISIIPELYIKQQQHQEDDNLHLIQELHFTSKEVIRKDDKDLFYCIIPLGFKYDDYILDFYIKVDAKKGTDYIEEYLDDWKNDRMTESNKNLLQARRQVGKVAYRIKRLLDDYPPTKLLIRHDESRYAESDFVATMLFLEQIKSIKILELCFTGKEVAFRVDVTDKFLQIFNDDGSVVAETIDVDLNEIAPGSVKGKETVDKIMLKAPKLLAYKEFEYEIKEDKVPYHLIHLARENGGVVEHSELKTTTKESPDRIHKALGNFRNNLRKKFNFPNSELFFERKGGLIKFKEDLFDFANKS